MFLDIQFSEAKFFELLRDQVQRSLPVVPDEFTAIDGTLTPTLKLRRRIVEERYRDQINSLYDEANHNSERLHT